MRPMRIICRAWASSGREGFGAPCPDPELKFNALRYTLLVMIRSFKCRDTQALFAGEGNPRFANFRAVAERKLAMLHRAVRLDDLRIPPNNHLEALKGDRRGQHGIRINGQWRLCFRFDGSDAFDLEIVDYH